MERVLGVGPDATAASETRSPVALQRKVAVEVQAPVVNFRSGEATHFVAECGCAGVDIGYVETALALNPNCRAGEAHSDTGGGMIAHLAADIVVVARTVGH